MFAIRRKVAILHDKNDYVVFHAHREQAIQMIQRQQAIVFECDPSGTVKTLRLVANAHATIDARPGSYGIRDEALPSGHHVYGHKDTYEQALAASL